MTVAIGLLCSDGAVVAADSMLSSGNVATRMTKVFACPHRRMIWAGAGSVSTIDEVREEFQRLNDLTDIGRVRCFTDVQEADLRLLLGERLRAALTRGYTQIVNVPGITPLDMGVKTLLLGYSNGRGWFFESAPNGPLSTAGQFAAMGSSGVYATVAGALLHHYLAGDLRVHEGLMLAYRAIDTTIGVSLANVGPPVQIAVCDAAGARVLNSEALDRLRTEVEGWKVLERESLASARRGDTGGAAELPTLPG